MNTPLTKESVFPPLAMPGDVADPADKQQTDVEAVLSMLAGLGDDSSVMLRIFREGKGRLPFIDEIRPAEFSLSRLQEPPFNGGDFRIHFRSKEGIMLNRMVSVEPRPVQGAAASPAPDMSAMMAPFQNQINQLTEIVKGLAGAVQASQNAAPTEMQMLEKLRLYKDLFGGGNAAPAADPLDMVSKVIEMSKSISGLGGGGEPQDALSVIMRAVETFKPVISMAVDNQRKMLEASPQPQPAAPAVPAIAPAASSTAESPESEQMNMMKMYFGVLIDKAANNSDPTGYAHLIVDNSTDEMIDSMLRPDNWLDNLAAIDDRVRQHPEWFGELREMIFELLTPFEESSKTVSDPTLRGNGAQQSTTGPVTNVSAPASSSKPDATGNT